MYLSTNIALLQDDRLKEKVEELHKHMRICMLCLHQCKVYRKEKTGFCQVKNRASSFSAIAICGVFFCQNHYRCHNINVVTPTYFITHIAEAVYLVFKKVFLLVYSCGGYERGETLKLLDDILDIYMPDYEYDYHETGRLYSGDEHYPDTVKRVPREMDRQVGGIKIQKVL